MPAPKAGVCPLPVLPPLPALTDTSFFAKAGVPHGRVEQVTYKNYTGQDKRISIDARTFGRWVDITVHDNGVGIPRDEQKALYEQFSRGREAVESGKPGMGLGLAFVQAIVKGNRGKLDLASRPGDTAFRIRLRKRREPETEAAGLPQRASA